MRSESERLSFLQSQSVEALLSSLPGLLAVIDAQGRIVWSNARTDRVLASTSWESAGKSAIGIVVPRDRERILSLLASTSLDHETELECSLLSGEKEIPIIGRCVKRRIADQVFTVINALELPLPLGAEQSRTRSESTDAAALDQGGRDLNSASTAQATNELAEWKQRYDLLVRAAGQVVYDRDAAGNIVWGGAGMAMLGYNSGDLLGNTAQWAEQIHPDDRAQAVRDYEEAVGSGLVYTAEYRFRKKSGEYLLIQDTGYPQFDEQGKMVRYVGVMANVTESKQAEVERRRLEDSLRQAQKMESIGRLAGGVAHDFNNLLTAIGGNLQLVCLNQNLDPAIRELLDEVNKAAGSAAKLTRQLLTFSRKQLINPRLLSLNDTVAGLQRILRRLLGEDIEVSVNLAEDLGLVYMDEGQLEQALVNLAVNARDAMPNGGKLTIETSNVTLDAEYCREQQNLSPGEYVMVAVSDDGCGMSEEVQAHLFEPFFTTKEIGKGTGLGLATVYGAVHQHRGHVRIRSELGRGTTVRLYLPWSGSGQRYPLVTSGAPPSGGVETIVLVEDEEQVRALAFRILTRHGYHVHAFSNGEDALLALAQMDQPIDLLLTDVVMPVMDGRALAERVRSIRPEIKVLFTSGYTEDVIGHHGVLEEGIEFIAKPYSVDRLTRRVREILDAKPVEK